MKAVARIALLAAACAAAVPLLAAQARDPFTPPPPPAKSAAAPAPVPRPAGLAGVSLDEIQIRGVALGGAGGPVALAAGPHDDVFFLRPGARLYDATVLRLDANGVWFERNGGVAVYRKVG